MSRADRRYVLLLLAPAALFLVVFVAWPLLNLFRDSLYEVALMTPGERAFVGLDNFHKALTSSRVGGAALRALGFTLIALSAEFTPGFGMALLFNSLGRRSELLRTLILFPPIVAGLLWRFLLIDNFGIVNHILHDLGLLTAPSDIAWLGDRDIVLFAVALAYVTISLPLAIWLLASFMESVPSELEDAARVDGCSRLTALLRVIVPVTAGGIVVTAIFCFLASWNEFLFALLLTSVKARTAPIVIAGLKTQYGLNWGPMTAVATLYSLPVIVFSLFMQRRIVAGMTMGAVKG